MFKRGGIYWTTVRGRKESLGTKIKSEAKRLEDKWRNEVYERKNGLYIPTYDEAAAEWLDANKHLSSYSMNEDMAEWWDQWFAGIKLNTITKEEVHKIVKANRPIDEVNKIGANTTANRYVLFLAKIIRSKITAPEFRMYPQPKGRRRWLRPEEWQSLMPHMQDEFRQLCTFALATGLREANVFKFEWAWLHGDKAYLPAAVTKTDEDYGIPLNRSAQAAIEERRKTKVRHQKYVFTHNGELWYTVKALRYLELACKAAGIERTVFHGFRHTFASWLAQKGVSDAVRSRLGCWSTGGKASDKYVHFDVEALRPFSNLLDEAIQQSVTILGQSEGKPLTQQAR